MVQDTLRSAVYRSLTKPGNQSVGYGINIKYKHSNHTDVNTPSSRRIACPQSFMEEEIGDDPGEKGHLHLFQASEGARELTQMIQSLTKAPNLDVRSKYIAKDLLKGAQDLQSSLVMLTKLQEASKSVSQPKVKGSQEAVEEDFGVQRSTRSKRFVLQEPRHSLDRSSMSCAEEMKRPSMLKLKQRYEFVEEEASLEEIKGSRRFGFQEPRHSVDGSARSFVGKNKKKPSKLRTEFEEEEVGVGEIMVSKRFRSRKSRFKKSSDYMEEKIGVEDIRCSKGVGMQKSTFSRDEFMKSNVGELKRMAAFKLKQKSNYVEEEIGNEEVMPSQRFGLQEPRFSIDSIQELRRVIKNSLSQQNLLPLSPNDEFDSRSQFPISPKGHRRPKFTEGPNVITKLMGLDEIPSATVQTNKQEEEKKKSSIIPKSTFDIDDKPKARKMQVVETPNLTQKTLHEIIAAMQFKGLLKSGRVENFRVKLHPFDASQFEKYRRSFNKEEDVPPIVIMKPLHLPHWDKTSAKEEIRSVDLVGENLDSDHPQLSAKESYVEVAQTANTLTTVAQKLQRKKASKNSKRTDAKKEEKEDTEKKRIPISQVNTTNYTAPVNPEKHVSASKNKASCIKPESKNSTIISREKTTSAVKSVIKFTDTKAGDEHCEDRKINNPQERADLFSENRTLTVHDLPQGASKEAKPCIHDGKQENLYEAKRKTRVASEAEEDLMCLLLSSRSFINHARELFPIDGQQPVNHRRKGIGEDIMKNAKLYLDCGKELTARRSRQHGIMPTACPSLRQLAEEISGVIDVLMSYSKADNSVSSEDDLYLRLARDLGCNDAMASANWDIGWANWVRSEEARQAVGEVEEFVLSWLITEVVQDLVWL